MTTFIATATSLRLLITTRSLRERQEMCQELATRYNKWTDQHQKHGPLCTKIVGIREDGDVMPEI